MMTTKRSPTARPLAATGLALLLALPAQSDNSATNARPFLSPLFGHHMVLQRSRTNWLWGWTTPGEAVRLECAGQSVTATAGPDGRWTAGFLPPFPTESLTLELRTAHTNLLLTNLAVGDVWLCGGQSNMEWPLHRARDGEAAVAAADHPNLRLFTVKPQPAYAHAETVDGQWRVCTPAAAMADGGVSAVGYYYARRIQRETNIPIGLIKNCWGGTPVESWTSAETLRALGEFTDGLREVERLHARRAPPHGNFITHWYDEYDTGQRGAGWFAPAHPDADWTPVLLPGGFRELGVPDTPAVAWFRKPVVLPDPLPPGPARLRLGVVERMDTVWLNGHWVGASAWVENPRDYVIPATALRPGTNLVAVRVFKTRPDGGFRSAPGELRITLGDGTVIPLAGEWKGRVSVDARPPHPLPVGFENWPTMPAVLYQGMIAPLRGFALAGALWYQGESNVGRAAQYRRLLPAMIADWRRAFGHGEVPFYLVSLAAFTPRRESPGDDAWAELREAQAFTARTVPNAGLAVAIDVGDADDIHPRDKQPVGERLALLALAQHYGRDVACSGPVFTRAEPLPGALRLHFAHTDGGLVVKGARLGEFSVAGAEGRWFWAEARIEGDTVVVSAPEVSEPKHARYAWQANPLATLSNGAGLPAVPFRTDAP
ncbi:MAG: sialate O-acetylesterase [Limisphaerales bacterium]